ncbi:hypothetical protein OE88DRAFT_1447603 [Heliocybe sulcata]|uniref:Uncharacterized protein n=1 Tax=Heliocybe sulcata TaxID=5364 RepID=A0A5C3N5A7_9AGAM|nr:hypothetical protein OE88DRAFT_1447603 [Heliocybe sulcata]
MGVQLHCCCGGSFRNGDHSRSLCFKCERRETATSDPDRAAIEGQPQCQDCGIIYPFLQGSICGRCKQSQSQNQPSSGGLDNPNQIYERTIAYEQAASDHRLNQKYPQNRNAAAATELKLKETQLKQQRKGDFVHVDYTLYRQDSLDEKVNQIRAVGSMRESFAADHGADAVFNKLLESGMDHYENIRKRSNGTLPELILRRDNTRFEVKATGKSYSISEDDMLYSIGSMMQSFHSRKMHLPQEDKKKTMSILVIMFEKGNDVDVENTVRKRPRTSKGTKESARLALSSAPPPSLQYRSAFRAPTLPVPTLQYDDYKFHMESWHADDAGALVVSKSDEEATILLAHDWQKNAWQGIRAGGFVGQGLSKWCFQGMFGAKMVAIAQLRPMDKTYATEDHNLRDLRDELRLLVLDIRRPIAFDSMQMELSLGILRHQYLLS